MPVINIEQVTPRIVEFLHTRLSELMGVYAFGSQIWQDAGPESDLDLAILVPGYVDRLILWELGSELAGTLNMDIDLLDLRAASTVMQYQVVTGGRRLWSAGPEADEFELFALSEKMDLDLWRQPIIDQIQEEGSIYGR